MSLTTWHAKLPEAAVAVLYDSELMGLIFSYLGSGGDDGGETTARPRETITLKEARQIHSTLSQVCTVWKGICDTRLLSILGPLTVIESDLEELDWVEEILPLRLKIGEVSCSGGGDQLLALLRQCDLESLHTAGVFNIDREYGLVQSQLLSLLISCRRLTTLKTEIILREQIDEFVSRDLLAGSKIEDLTISVDDRTSGRWFTQEVFEMIIEDLSCLERLTFRGSMTTNTPVKALASNSLRRLDVTDLRGLVLSECSFPRLELFACSVDCISPITSQEDLRCMQKQLPLGSVACIPPRPAGSLPLLVPGFEVPPTCVINFVKNWEHWTF